MNVNTCQDYYRQLINDGAATGTSGVEKNIKSSSGSKIDNSISVSDKQNLCEWRLNESGDQYLLGTGELVSQTGCKYHGVPEYYKDLNLVDKCSISDLHKKLMDSGMTSTDMNQIEFTSQCPRRQIGYDLSDPWICSDITGSHRSNYQKGKADCDKQKDCIDPEVYKKWVDAEKPIPAASGWVPQWTTDGYKVTVTDDTKKKLEHDCSWRPVIERAEYVDEDSPCVLRCKGGSIQSGGQPYCDSPPDFLQDGNYNIGYLYPYLNPEWNTNDFSCTLIDESTCGDDSETPHQRTISWDSNLNRHTIKTTPCDDSSSQASAAGVSAVPLMVYGFICIAITIFCSRPFLQTPNTSSLTKIPAAAIALWIFSYGTIMYFWGDDDGDDGDEPAEDDGEGGPVISTSLLNGSLILWLVWLAYFGGVLPNVVTIEVQNWTGAAGAAPADYMAAGFGGWVMRLVMLAPLILCTVAFYGRPFFGEFFGDDLPIFIYPVLALVFILSRVFVQWDRILNLPNRSASLRWFVATLIVVILAVIFVIIDHDTEPRKSITKGLNWLGNATFDDMTLGGLDKGGGSAAVHLAPNKCKVYSDCKYDDNCIWDEIVSIIDDSKNFQYSSPSTEMMEVIYGFTYIIHKYKDKGLSHADTFTTPFYDPNNNSDSKIDRLNPKSFFVKQWMAGWDTDPTDKASLFINEHGDSIRIADLVSDAGLSVRQLKELFLYYWDLLHDGTTGKIKGIVAGYIGDDSPGKIWKDSPLSIEITKESQIDQVYSRGTEMSDVANDERTRGALPIIRLLLKDWINRNMKLTPDQCVLKSSDKVCKYGKDESDKCKSSCYNDEILDYARGTCLDSTGGDLFEGDKMGHNSTSFRNFGPNFQRFYCELKPSGAGPNRELTQSGNTYQKFGCIKNDLINNDAIRGESCGDYSERAEASGYNIDCNSTSNTVHIKELAHDDQAMDQAMNSLLCWTQFDQEVTNEVKEGLCGYTDTISYTWDNSQNIDSSNIDPRSGNSIFNPAAVGIGRKGSGYSDISPILSCCQKVVDTADPVADEQCYSGTWYSLSADGSKGICSSATITGGYPDGYTRDDINHFSQIYGTTADDFCGIFDLFGGMGQGGGGCRPRSDP
jgi:hypothetical protein